MRSLNQIENDIQSLLIKPAATVKRHKFAAITISVLMLLAMAQFFVIVNMADQHQALIKKVNHQTGFNGWRESGFDLYQNLPALKCTPSDNNVSI